MTTRVAIASVQPGALLGGAPIAGALTKPLVATDHTNGNKTVLTGAELFVVQNSDIANPYTITFSSVGDALGRTGDITTYSLAAGEIAFIGPFPTQGWQQTDGYIYYNSSNDAIKVLPLKLSGSMIYR